MDRSFSVQILISLKWKEFESYWFVPGSVRVESDHLKLQRWYRRKPAVALKRKEIEVFYSFSWLGTLYRIDQRGVPIIKLNTRSFGHFRLKRALTRYGYDVYSVKGSELW